MAQVILADTQSLINDALFRAGEIPGASEWDSKALDYINREYRALCAGASEFLPEVQHDWWWMRRRGVITLLPAYMTGTVLMTNGVAAGTLSVDPTPLDLTNYRIRFDDVADVFSISVHAGVNITLDSPFTGATGSYSFKAMKVLYTLDTTIDAIMSPLSGLDGGPSIYGLAPERMEELFPVSRLNVGLPQAYSIENDQTIRFSHGGAIDSKSRRLEFVYRPSVDDLENSATNFPLLPMRFRHVLADMTLVYLYMDKNDDRLTAIGTSVRSALAAMVAENRRRITKVDSLVGKIQPRQTGLTRNQSRLLRTESGLIIG